MTNSIKKFQSDVVRNDISLDQILREGYMIANQRSDTDIIQWIHNELYGYKNCDQIPEYRMVSARLVAIDNYDKLLSVAPLPDGTMLKSVRIEQSIDSIEDIINSEKNYVVLSFPDDQLQSIYRLYGHKKLNFGAQVLTTNLVNVRGQVRNKIMSWATDLPNDESISQDTLDKRQASVVVNGDNNQIQVANSKSKQSRFKHWFDIHLKLGSLLEKLFGK